MNLWKDRRVDSLHRVVLPREAFSLLGWTSDEVLEAEALPAQDALLLRAPKPSAPAVLCVRRRPGPCFPGRQALAVRGLPCRRERRKQSLIFSTRRSKKRPACIRRVGARKHRP